MSVLHWTELFRRIVFAAIACAVMAGTVVSSARGTEVSEPEEWIFSVITPPQWMIAEALFAYQFEGSYYLPVVELAEGFEFFVESEADRAYVTGFAGREENSFTIDGERGELIIQGEREALPVESIIPPELLDGQDVYVRVDVLNRIWPVEMRVDLPSITIIAEPDEGADLAFIQRKERKNRQAIAEARNQLQKASQKNLPYVENGYKWLGKPAVDVQTSWAYDKTQRELSGNTNVSGAQQLGKFVVDYSGTFNYREGTLIRPDSIRTKFFRQAPKDESLLIPSVKRIEFGDVSLAQRDLVGSNASGRGFVVSNNESEISREFDRITLEGTGPPDWEIELYNNNELIDFGAVESDGEYRFEDIVLTYGNNRLRVILYGPQGQVREEVFEYDIGGSLLSPGEVSYEIGLLDTDRPFIVLDTPENQNYPEILTKNGELFYGLNKWLTVFGSYSEVEARNELEKYYTGGVAMSTPVGVAEVEAYKQINGGRAVDLRFITELLGVRLNLRGAYFNDFESSDAGFGGSAKRYETEVQANKNLKLPFMPLSLRLNMLHREFVNGNKTTTLGTTQSFTGGGLRFNNSTTTRLVNDIHTSSNGTLNVNWNRGRYQTRASFNYNLYPESDLASGTAEVRYKNRDDFQAAINLQHDFLQSTTTVGGQIGYDFDDILTTLDTRYSQEQGWLFTLRASTSLNPYYSDKSYRLSSESRRNQAPVLGRIFLDRDLDGTFTEGDEPLPGARLQVGRVRGRDGADENGFVVAALRQNQINDVSIDESSLKDPYFRPSVEGYSTFGLRGSMPGFDFPVVETGSIDGTVYRDSNGTPISGMTLQLVKPDGEVYMTVETAFDGYYAFEFVLPGTYTVRADPAYQVNVPPETVEVSSDELFAFGIDLYLIEPAAEESAAEQLDGESGRVAQTNHAPAVPGTGQPARFSLPDEGSSLAAEDTTHEDVSPAVESANDEGRSFVDARSSGGGAPSIVSEQKPDVPVSAQVKDIRVGEHPDKVRVVLDLSSAVDFAVKEGDTGMVVMIDIPAARWDAEQSRALPYNMVLKEFKVEELANGGARLLLVARDTMLVKDSAVLPAAKGGSPRLYIDLARP